MKDNKRYSLNLKKITPGATKKLMELDETFVNTPDYMGVTYFWHYDYRHYLRDNRNCWIKIHTAMLKNGLDVTESSRAHLDLIKLYVEIQ